MEGVMSDSDPCAFDIDVDLSPLCPDVDVPVCVPSGWYELAKPRAGRPMLLQAKLDTALRNALLHATWAATSRRRLDRRRGLRVPLISRVHVGRGDHLTACDISLTGLRCSGRPLAPVMDIEFRLPGLAFPVDARVEVVSFKEANVIPLVGMRFAWIDRPYVDHIARYISRRRLPQAA